VLHLNKKIYLLERGREAKIRILAVVINEIVDKQNDMER